MTTVPTQTPAPVMTGASAPMVPEPYTIRRVKRDNVDTWTYDLQPERGGLFTFAPGQFTMLYVFGVGEAPVSISGDPGQPDTLVHTVRAVGPVTNAMSRLKPGQTLGVRGPYGTTWPVDAADGKDVVIVAGGLGLAPVRPVIYHVLAHRERYGKFVLLYGARTPGMLLYARELERWRGRLDMQVDVTVDHAPGGWRGNVGVVPQLLRRAQFDPLHTVAMTCGPEVMMRFTIQALQNRGVDDENIFLSMERNMKCAVGFCGHCQLGPTFICKDGPVFSYPAIEPWFRKREV